MGGHKSSHKFVERPDVGELALNSDVLTTQDTDLRLVIYTQQPNTDAGGELELLAAIGLRL